MTTITRPLHDRRTLAEMQEAALLAAFRRMKPRERVRLLRAVRRQKSSPAAKRTFT